MCDYVSNDDTNHWKGVSEYGYHVYCKASCVCPRISKGTCIILIFVWAEQASINADFQHLNKQTFRESLGTDIFRPRFQITCIISVLAPVNQWSHTF